MAVICMLPVSSLAVFFTESLWSNLEISFFKELVILYQRASQEILLSFVQEFKATGPIRLYNLDPVETGPLQILQMLYQVRKCLDPN